MESGKPEIFLPVQQNKRKTISPCRFVQNLKSTKNYVQKEINYVLKGLNCFVYILTYERKGQLKVS